MKGVQVGMSVKIIRYEKGEYRIRKEAIFDSLKNYEFRPNLDLQEQCNESKSLSSRQDDENKL